MRHLLAFCCAALLCGCNHINGIFGAEDEAELYTDRALYGSEDAITLTLANRADGKTLSYNLCASTLEEYRGGRWQTTAVQEDWVCTAALYVLDAGKQTSFVFDFDQPMPAGLYRFKGMVFLQNKNTRLELLTNEFRVR